MTDIISTKQDAADKAYEQLLDTVQKANPELTELLQKKYEDDRREFVQAAKEFMPSEDPEYWAKRSCRKCYGRGIIGKRHIFQRGSSAKSIQDESGKKTLNSMVQVDVRCTCTQKSYRKWLSEFRVFFNMLRAQALADAVETARGEINNA